MDYIKLPAVIEKLKSAESKFLPVWISAPTGYGKTSAIKDYYAFKSMLCISGKNGMLDQRPEFSKIRQSVVFVDDVSFVADQNSQRYILSLLNQKNFQTILAGRGKFPEWLEDIALQIDFVFISEQEFLFHETQMIELFEHHGIFLENLYLDADDRL